MATGVHGRRTDFLRITALAVVAVSAGACSSLPTVPDWVDPTTWWGGDSGSADSGETPDLAGVPDKPQATPPDDQQQVAESLAADRAHAKYSADALRGGTEVASAPPPNVAAPQASEEAAAPTAAASGRSRAPAAVAEPVRTAQADRSIARDPSGRTIAGTLPETPPASQVAMVETPAPAESAVAPAPAQPAPTAVAAAQPPARPSPPAMVQTAMVSPSDASLGFKPSTAPPLDPSITQFVAAPIVQRYQQTAADAGLAYRQPTVIAVNQPHRRAHHRHRSSTGVASSSGVSSSGRSARGVGGPEHMTGSVVANLEVLGPAVPNPSPAVYADAQGNPATAVVFFPGDGVYLNATARTQVAAAVEQYNASGGRGFIRVVGHSSSRTPNMSVARHVEIIFRKSQQRADAVAREIIRRGVPANKVLVEAVGDSQPVYYESMPKGEDGNRRAEIFVQG
jgi:outer membrane protein OmpA-like peptidoglycan-associated protein